MNRLATLLICAFFSLFLWSCSSDEDDTGNGPQPGDVMDTEFHEPYEIEVDAAGRRALLLHNQNSPSGAALQLIDLEQRHIVSTLILDYYDIYDVAFIDDTSAVFAGRPQGNIGYALQFFSLNELALTDRVLVEELEGTAGTVAVDTAHGFVYYSHDGGDEDGALFKIDAETRELVDADDDNAEPYSLDNQLVSGLFDGPSKIFYDYDDDVIVVGNSEGEFVTLVSMELWGTLTRSDSNVFPVAGTDQISTVSSDVSNVHMNAAATGGGVYAFAGMHGSVAYLSRFRLESNGLDFVEVFTDRDWKFMDRGIVIHPRADIFSVFVVQEDSNDVTIGQYRLNNLGEVAASPYHVRFVEDSSISALAIDVMDDVLIVGDANSERLEFIEVGP